MKQDKNKKDINKVEIQKLMPSLKLIIIPLWVTQQEGLGGGMGSGDSSSTAV
jgi:hypothetical protein